MKQRDLSKYKNQLYAAAMCECTRQKPPPTRQDGKTQKSASLEMPVLPQNIPNIPAFCGEGCQAASQLPGQTIPPQLCCTKERNQIIADKISRAVIPTCCGALRPSTKTTRLTSGTAVILVQLLLHKLWCIRVSKHQSRLPGQ